MPVLRQQRKRTLSPAGIRQTAGKRRGKIKAFLSIADHSIAKKYIARGTAMRIDLNPSAMPELDRSNSATSGSKTHDMTNRPPANAEDVAHLSTGSDTVQTLKAQLDKVPEVRQQKVDSLKLAIAEGSYQMYPQQIAAAMFAGGGLNLG
jgi:flagellar biosynthesis anti-sigma factor FlgM